MGEHEIRIVPESRVGGETWYRATCSCGRYRSGLHASPGRAEIAGIAHRNARERTDG